MVEQGMPKHVRFLRLWQIIEVGKVMVSAGGLLVGFQMIQVDQIHFLAIQLT